MTCDAKIRPFTDNTELTCEVDQVRTHRHMGVLRDYAYPGSRSEIYWLEDDRRCYHGEWPGTCEHTSFARRCTLPAGHQGRHNLE